MAENKKAIYPTDKSCTGKFILQKMVDRGGWECTDLEFS